MGAQSSRLARQASVSLLGKRQSSSEVNLLAHRRTIVQSLESFAAIQYPCQSSTWIRGSPVCIQWTVLDPSVVAVRLELCQIGSPATTVLVSSAPNTGCYVLERVPWGVLGDGFYIRMSEIHCTDTQAERTPRCTLSQVFSVATSRWISQHDKKKKSIAPSVFHMGLVEHPS